MKIYTKTGDKGRTSLLSGGRVSKSNLRIKAYGSVDELNSFVGMLAAFKEVEKYIGILTHIQHKLYNIGSILAVKGETAFSLPKIKKEDIENIENEIDKLNLDLPPIKDFILPGGNKVTAQCHICRSVCRRVEREIVELTNEEDVNFIVIKFINRLSDYLFVLARKISKETNAAETVWKQ